LIGRNPRILIGRNPRNLIGRNRGWCRQREKIDWQEQLKFDCRLVRTILFFCSILGWCRPREKIDWQEASKFDCRLVRTIFIFCSILGWCRPREKIDWQEASKFDCRLVRTIFIFCCPSSILASGQKIKFDFDSCDSDCITSVMGVLYDRLILKTRDTSVYFGDRIIGTS